MLRDLETAIVELYRKAATELPQDVRAYLRKSISSEKKGGLAYFTLSTIVKNVDIAARKKKPLCQDTGTPIFFVQYGPNFRQKQLKMIIEKATERATDEVPLRSNSVDILTGKNTGNNVACGIPVIYFEERDEPGVEMGLILKGGGCENVGLTYKLPNLELQATRNLDGIRRCVLDSAQKAQGQGCPPMIASVVAGSPADLIAIEAKRQLFRSIETKNSVPELDAFEKKLTREINELGIGPGGFGGKNTVMATFVSLVGRHPASFFVTISYFCWASRRAILQWNNGSAIFTS
ncbi:fumarate hydratase [Candidatus Peregrinibacteria bacterium]|nr:fumarate hydratase [Candidatus Peregrinibacteria bacterium]